MFLFLLPTGVSVGGGVPAKVVPAGDPLVMVVAAGSPTETVDVAIGPFALVVVAGWPPPGSARVVNAWCAPGVVTTGAGVGPTGCCC